MQHADRHGWPKPQHYDDHVDIVSVPADNTVRKPRRQTRQASKQAVKSAALGTHVLGHPHPLVIVALTKYFRSPSLTLSEMQLELAAAPRTARA